jgi:hypothetical protein
MAVIENIKIEGDASKLIDAIDQLNKRVDELEEKFGGAEDGVNDLGKSGKKNASIIDKAFGGLKKVITAPFDVAKKAASGLGSLLKGGLGFGLITAAVDKASEAFNTNQGVVDSLNKVLGTVSIIFNQIASAIGEVFEEQSALNGGFDATKKVLGGLISGVLNVFVGIIQGIKLAVLTAQLAWEESFFGDGDVTRIKELNEGIAETKEALKQTGEALLESGKMVIDNLAEAAQEVSSTVVAVATRVQDEIKNLDVSKAVAQAERLVELQKQAELADVRRQEIQLKFQNTQEQLRQLRDDEMKSIEERQAANSQLLLSLEKQAELEREQIQIKVAAAQAEYNITKTNENLIKLKQAQLELTDLDERLQGQRSEALSNQNSLMREQLDLMKSQRETALDVYQLEQEANLVLINNELERAQKQMEIDQSVYDSRVALLESQAGLYAEGTQARIDAENEIAQLEAEHNVKRLEYEKTLRDARFESEQAKLQMVADGFSAISQLSAAFADDDEKSKKKQFELQKKLSLASAIVAGIQAVQNAYKTAQGSPYTLVNPAYPYIQAGLASAFAVAQVASIARSQYESPSASISSGVGGGMSAPSASPSFNVVGQSGINQLAESIGQQNRQPMRAYVVGSDVTSSQELERKRIKTATFG